MPDSDRWLAYLRRDRCIRGALLSCKVKLKGPVKLLKAFGRCFPS